MEAPPLTSAQRASVTRGFGWWSIVRGAGWFLIAVGIFILIVGKTGESGFGFAAVLATIPIVIGVLLARLAKLKSVGVICSACGNPIAPTSKLCPTCRATLS